MYIFLNFPTEGYFKNKLKINYIYNVTNYVKSELDRSL